jgi:cellulose synthase/poly-beta-1,6-N-acetylglucosamine synthase-like glycosyltransferase
LNLKRNRGEREDKRKNKEYDKMTTNHIWWRTKKTCMSILVSIFLSFALLALLVLITPLLIAPSLLSNNDIYGTLNIVTKVITLRLFTNTITSTLYTFVENIWFYLPLATIGIWRWGVWLFKRICAQRYRPIHAVLPAYYSSLSIITTVYNENSKTFAAALNSWQANEPDELIAVIDHTDRDCIHVFKQFSQNKPWAKLIITSKPGKRPALADGILIAKSKIVALVDSDTIWAPNIKYKLLAPFRDPEIGGVTMRNHPIECHSIWQKMTDIFWDMRNFHDLPSQTAMGGMLTCLSGRSSLYRREIIVPKLEEVLNEILFGKKKESGEDKCLTRLIQSEGWKTYYQDNAEVYSSATNDFKIFCSQRLRWTRNSHNSDLASLLDGWVWKHPYLAFYMIDRFISIFTLFLGPIYFGIAIYMNHWLLALSIVIWWILGRAIKITPHLKRRHKDVLVLPVYVTVTFLIAFIKLYALVTISEQKWIREVKDRKEEETLNRYFKRMKDVFLTTEIIGGLVILVCFFVFHETL